MNRCKIKFLSVLVILGAVSFIVANLKREDANKVHVTSIVSKTSAEQDVVSQENADKVFKILDTGTGEIVIMSDREFMYGALAYEVPPSFEMEALKAQAVAIYTYFCHYREQPTKSADLNGADFKADLSHGEFYLNDNLLHERLGSNFDENFKKIKDAVDSVYMQKLMLNGETILAMYHSISGGYTQNCKDVFVQDLPYLRSVPSPADKFAPGYQTFKQFTFDEFKDIVSAQLGVTLPDDKNTWIHVQEKSPTGLVMNLQIADQNISGSKARSIFSLRSSTFNVGISEDRVTFTVYGHGHSVGMSQYGAQYMAEQGASYKDILSWYYPTASLSGC